MPRHPRDRRGRACARRARDRRQHLGDAALSPLARPGRRHQHAGRHQIYRRPFRHHVRHDLGQREGLADASPRTSACSASAPDLTTSILALRGMRTLSVRLAQHYRSGLEMARWLATRPEVAQVLHPALESHPGHAIWKRDFTGASGLFSIVLKPGAAEGGRCPARHRKAVRHGLFMGRLRKPRDPVRLRPYRTATKWSPGGPTLRLHIGLENVDDLKADLERGFAALKAAVERLERRASSVINQQRAAAANGRAAAPCGDPYEPLAVRAAPPPDFCGPFSAITTRSP